MFMVDGAALKVRDQLELTDGQSKTTAMDLILPAPVLHALTLSSNVHQIIHGLTRETMLQEDTAAVRDHNRLECTGGEFRTIATDLLSPVQELHAMMLIAILKCWQTHKIIQHLQLMPLLQAIQLPKIKFHQCQQITLQLRLLPQTTLRQMISLRAKEWFYPLTSITVLTPPLICSQTLPQPLPPASASPS